MIPIVALFSKIKIFESCTCGGAQRASQIQVKEPPLITGMKLISKGLENKYIYA